MGTTIEINVLILLIVGLLWIGASFFCLRHKWKESKACCLSDLMSTAVTGITLAITASVMINLVQINNVITTNTMTQIAGGPTLNSIQITQLLELANQLETSVRSIQESEDNLGELVKLVDTGDNVPVSGLRYLQGSISFSCNASDGQSNCKWIPGAFKP